MAVYNNDLIAWLLGRGNFKTSAVNLPLKISSAFLAVADSVKGLSSVIGVPPRLPPHPLIAAEPPDQAIGRETVLIICYTNIVSRYYGQRINLQRAVYAGEYWSV